MGFLEIVQFGVGRLLVQIDAIPGQDFAEVEPINGGQGIQAEDRRHNRFVFDFAQAAETNRVFFV